jgi:hypothetical protein
VASGYKDTTDRADFCDIQVIKNLDTRFSVKSVCLLWYMGRVQIIKGTFVISIRYRSLNVNRVKWKIALEVRRNIILGVNLCYHKEKV